MPSTEPKLAVIFPLHRDHIYRIFEGRTVFCKYARQTSKSFGEGSKLLFYASKSGSSILGEARIDKMEWLNPAEALESYGGKLFLDKDELEHYRVKRQRSSDRRMMVMSLSRIKRYDPPIKFPKVVTMAGQTLSKSEYGHLVKREEEK